MTADVSAVLYEKFGLRACAGLDGREGRPALFRSRALADAGYVVARFPGGERYLLAVDSVKTSESFGGRCTEVSVGGQEVS